MKLVVEIDNQGGRTCRTYKSKNHLRKFLQRESCSNSYYSDENYYKHNGHISLEEYLEIFQCSFIELTDRQVADALQDYIEKHNLEDNFGETWGERK